MKTYDSNGKCSGARDCGCKAETQGRASPQKFAHLKVGIHSQRDIALHDNPSDVVVELV